MKEREFKGLLQQIECGTFEGNKIYIDGSSMTEEGEKNPDALDDSDVIALVRVLNKNPNITILELPCNEIGETGCEILMTLKYIHTLDLHENEITTKGVMFLAKGMFKNLILSYNDITHKFYTSDLESFYHSYSSEEELQEMINSLIKNKTIEVLNLSICGLYSAHNMLIGQLISENNTIKKLCLGDNQLTDEVLVYIGNNIKLETLLLDNNLITDVGVEYIMENYSLKELVFGENKKLTYKAAKLLAQHTTLEELSINFINSTIQELKDRFAPDEVAVSGEVCDNAY